MHQQARSARHEHRDSEMERVARSSSLEEAFTMLTKLTVELSHFRAERPERRSSHVKYSLNLHNAKSVLLFSCPNDQCIGGDFDLSAPLAEAVAARSPSVLGEITCQGWRNNATIGSVRCHNLLRYKLDAVY
jgi:hypothetical protein